MELRLSHHAHVRRNRHDQERPWEQASAQRLRLSLAKCLVASTRVSGSILITTAMIVTATAVTTTARHFYHHLHSRWGLGEASAMPLLEAAVSEEEDHRQQDRQGKPQQHPQREHRLPP